MGARADRGGGPRARKFSAEVLEGLIAHCAHERALSTPQKDGYTQRQHLEAALDKGFAAAEAALEGPGLPPEAEYLWDWFCELNDARGGNGFAPNPIGYGELEAWARLTGRRLAPWEVRWLRLVDRAWIAEPKKKAAA